MSGWLGLDARTVRAVHETLAHIQAEPDVERSAWLMAETVTSALGFRSCAVNVVSGDRVVTTAVSGPEPYHRLIGASLPLPAVRAMLEDSEPFGGLLLHRDPSRFFRPDAVVVPDDPGHGGPGRWSASSMLSAPMCSASGELTGLVVCDAEAGTELPSPFSCSVLEMLAGQAGMALDRQRLTERLARERDRLARSQTRFRLAFDQAPIGMVLVELRPRGVVVTRANDALRTMFAISGRRPPTRPPLSFFHEAEQPAIQEGIQRFREDPHASLTVEAQLVRADGSPFWGVFHAVRLPAEEPDAPPMVLAQLVDITANKDAQRHLQHQAQHDPLTGLVNRSILLDRVEAVVEEAAAGGQRGAVLFCDLDQFKRVNDDFGHAVGDQVLATIADRIRSAVRRTDTVGRIGGDEFVVVAPATERPEAATVAARVIAAVAEPIAHAAGEMRVTVSIGGVVVTGALDAARVLKRADQAMYDSKHKDRGEGAVFVEA